MAKFKYPRGVFALSSIEMWERFSFYTMQSLLVLYASAKIIDGGLGWSNADALKLVGYYGALVYISPIIGGAIADKWLGHKLAVFWGSLIMMFGHISLAFTGENAMYLGLALLISGCGLMKPAISAMVGAFFSAKEASYKESAYAIFYMAINIGGTLGAIIAGFVQERYGYSYAFTMAALGLVIAIINFLLTKNNSLKDVGNAFPKLKQVRATLSTLEKKKIALYLGICISNIFWNIIYALPYSLLTLYAAKNIDRQISASFTIPATWYFALYGILIIVYSPLLATFYQVYRNKFGRDISLSWKLATGYLLVAGGSLILLPLVKQIAHNPDYIGSSWYLIGFYSLFSLSELLTIPVLLGAATTFAPRGYSATLVSLNMAISWAIGAWLGGLFGAWTQSFDSGVLFCWVIGLSLVFGCGHILSNRKIEQIIAE